MMKKLILTFLAAAICLATKAQIPQPDPDTTAAHFLTVASISNLQEASAGQQAAKKGKNSDVKTFGQMMVDDHRVAQQALLNVAKANSIILPAAATGGIIADPALANAGDRFDELYVHAMVCAHRNAVETFQYYAVTGKNPGVKAFAQKTLPTLKQHLAAIQVIEAKMK